MTIDHTGFIDDVANMRGDTEAARQAGDRLTKAVNELSLEAHCVRLETVRSRKATMSLMRPNKRRRSYLIKTRGQAGVLSEDWGDWR